MNANWEDLLKDRLQLYGHRNWLVIADSAYPAQSRQAIETIVADEEQTTVLERTFAILGGCKHIKPNIYTDKELTFVREEDAPGIRSYRKGSAVFSRSPKCASFHTKRSSRSSIGWRVVSSARRQDQHANSVYLCVFRTGLRILECSSREDRLRAAMRSGNRDRKSRKA